MRTVSIEADAKYRWDEHTSGYREVCGACGVDRRGESERCACGHVFERKQRGFFVTAWDPASLAVRFPERCPHCGARPTKTIKIWNSQYTKLVGTSAQETHKDLVVPVCGRVRSPLLLYFTLVAMAAITGITAVLTAIRMTTGTPWPGLAATLLFGSLTYLAWRARSWIRFSHFDHRSYRFKARREDYARALARLNSGRIV